MTGVELIQQERDRQIYQEGFDSKHDYEHVNNELARAAICYADPYQYFNLEDSTKIIPNEDFWPEEWDKKWFKPTTRVRDLTKAGALIAAEIDRLLRIEINENKKTLIPEIKRLVDNAFGEFGEEGDNVIVIGAANYPEDARHVCETDDILYQIEFNCYINKYNKLYYPIGRRWDVDENGSEGRKKYDSLWENYMDPLRELLNKIGVPYIEDYYKDENDGLNEYWYGCIGIMKDYKVVSFIIRGDGMLSHDDGYENYANKIIMQL